MRATARRIELVVIGPVGDHACNLDHDGTATEERINRLLMEIEYWRKENDRKRSIAKAVVQFVEQVYKDIHGEEKLFAALDRASQLLAEKGIKFSAVEMETLIEAAVAEFNEAFHKQEITEGSTE